MLSKSFRSRTVMRMPPAIVTPSVTTAIATAARRAVNGLFNIHLSSQRSSFVVVIVPSAVRAAAAVGVADAAARWATPATRPLDHVLAPCQEQHRGADRARH